MTHENAAQYEASQCNMKLGINQHNIIFQHVCENYSHMCLSRRSRFCVAFFLIFEILSIDMLENASLL